MQDSFWTQSTAMARWGQGFKLIHVASPRPRENHCYESSWSKGQGVDGLGIWLLTYFICAISVVVIPQQVDRFWERQPEESYCFENPFAPPPPFYVHAFPSPAGENGGPVWWFRLWFSYDWEATTQKCNMNVSDGCDKYLATASVYCNSLFFIQKGFRCRGTERI